MKGNQEVLKDDTERYNIDTTFNGNSFYYVLVTNKMINFMKMRNSIWAVEALKGTDRWGLGGYVCGVYGKVPSWNMNSVFQSQHRLYNIHLCYP